VTLSRRLQTLLTFPLLSAAVLTGWVPAAWAVTLGQPGVIRLAQAKTPPVARQRVAVVDFRAIDVPATLAAATAETLRSALIQLNRVSVIERGQIEQVIREQRFNGTGLVDGDAAITLGKLVGAGTIIVGSVTRFGQTYTINARALDTLTGEALTAANVSTRYADDIPTLIPELCRTLFPSGQPDLAHAGVPPAASPAPVVVVTPAVSPVQTVILAPSAAPTRAVFITPSAAPTTVATATRPAETPAVQSPAASAALDGSAEPTGQSKALALLLGLMVPGGAQAYAGNWDNAGTTILWYVGGMAAVILSPRLSGPPGFIVFLSGLGTALTAQIIGAIEGMNAVQETKVREP
jgi:hypothetical protein